jgi:hypothetical protein
MNISEKADAKASTDASVSKNVSVFEAVRATGQYPAFCIGPKEEYRARYVELRDKIATAKSHNFISRLLAHAAIAKWQYEMDAIPLEEKWRDVAINAVTAEGANFILDKGFAGSGYTATWFVGLYNSGYSPAGTETYAAKGGTENTNYSQAARPTAAWSSASARSKAFSSNAVFSINGAGGTIAGAFLVAGSSTKGDSTASAGVNVLWSIGAFSGGNKTVANGDTLNVGYSTAM